MIQTQTDTRNRIAVFIDFDNVEIGVKSTIGGQFDIGLVLEAIKERGEIVTKIAYSDWKRVGDYSRLLTQHAIRMVQRNMTPGGDKNGADITMALDALEMAFTHDHINAFVIVGGDSDFISLVEKLKQYGRKVIVVGGRQFTSVTMQRNCHEFIAYENLVGSHTSGHRRQAERGGKQPSAAATGGAPIAQALPLVLRALKVLSEREVTPQLGLLKSTLLQLDSTFSEREFGAGSFRDFMEKVAVTGAVELKHAGRSMLVEAVSGAGDIAAAAAAAMPAPAEAPVATVDSRSDSGSDSRSESRPDSRPIPRAAVPARASMEANGNGLPVDHDGDEDEEALPPSPMSMQDGIKAVQHAFSQAPATVRWPMYVRQARQFLRTAIEGFDERKYGFASVVDLLRAAGKESVLRIERDRQGAVRVFPGANLTPKVGVPSDDDGSLAIDENMDVEVPQAQVAPESFEVDQQVVEGTIEPTDATLLDDRYAAQDAAEDAAAAAVHGAEGSDEDGPQPGNELHPRASSRQAPRAAAPHAGGRKRKPTSHAASSHAASSRAPRAPRAAAPAARPARPRARKAAKPRSGGD